MEPIEPMDPEIKEAIIEALVGGNHLADVLFDRLPLVPDYHKSLQEGADLISNISIHDMWHCWRGLMLLRDALNRKWEDEF